MLPLDGFRVLDCTRYLSGPYCTMILAELGADVVKIEQPGLGDDARRLGPMVNGESYPFAMPNRSKRSVSLDLKEPRGRDAFLRMVAGADLVIENFRPGVVKRLGIDYDTLRGVRPEILYCSISGYGQTGPYRDRPGFDIMAQGMTGLMRMTGDPGGRPAKVGIAITDLIAGVTALYSVMAAELLRRRTGEGQYIDVSLVDAALAWTVWESGAYFANGELPAQTGTRHRRTTPYQAYRTADGYVTIGANNDRLWRRLVLDVLERPDWLDDPRFDTLPARMDNIDALEGAIEAVTTTRTTAEWIKILDRAGVPGGPVFTYDEALDDPQVAARRMLAEVEHPIIGTVRTIAPPTKFSGLTYAVRGAAPWLGQHTTEVLRENGLGADEIAALFADGVAYDRHPDRHPGTPPATPAEPPAETRAEPASETAAETPWER